MPQTLIWDLPLRLCHWAIVALVFVQWVTVEMLDDAIDWHAWGGYALLGVVSFRIIWGVIGTHYAKFSQFLASPISCIGYIKDSIKGEAPVFAGHNPLGGWMALLLLLLLAIQGVSGMFMTDDVFFNGPYYSAVSSDIQGWMSWLHHQVFTVIQFAVLAHVSAAIFYVLIKKQPLIRAMFTGKKPVNSTAIERHFWKRAMIIALVVAVLLYLVIDVWAPVPEDIWTY